MAVFSFLGVLSPSLKVRVDLIIDDNFVYYFVVHTCTYLKGGGERIWDFICSRERETEKASCPSQVRKRWIKDIPDLAMLT